MTTWTSSPGELAELGTRFFWGRNRLPTGSGLTIARAVLGAWMSVENKHNRTSGTCNVTPVADGAAAVRPSA